MSQETIEKSVSHADQQVTTFIVHVGGETRVVKVSAHEEIAVIIEKARFGAETEETFIFLGEFNGALVEAIEIEDGEDDHKPVGPHERPHHHGHHGGVVHIHRHKCHRVKVEVSYNGVDKHHRFSPAATVETVRLWAVKKFKISPTDAEKLYLYVLGSETPLDITKHIGDVATAPGCHTDLVLLPDPLVNG
jgi:hypothetical protein